MVSELPRHVRSTVRSALNRFGQRAEVRRPDGTATENRYGKIEDKSYKVVDTITAIRRTRRFSDEAQERTVDGGVINTDQPRIVAPLDANIQTDDRLAFLSELVIASNDHYTIYSGEREVYTNVVNNGTLTINGELIVKDPDVYKLETEFSGRQAYREFKSNLIDG